MHIITEQSVACENVVERNLCTFFQSATLSINPKTYYAYQTMMDTRTYLHVVGTYKRIMIVYELHLYGGFFGIRICPGVPNGQRTCNTRDVVDDYGIISEEMKEHIDIHACKEKHTPTFCKRFSGLIKPRARV